MVFHLPERALYARVHPLERKLLMGAVVASVSLAVATGAVAQDPAVQFSAR